MAAIDNTKKSARLLQSRRYTHDTYTDAQEAFTSTLDINANEVYVDQMLVPSSGLPFSGSGQNGSIYSVAGQDVIKYWYRQPLTKSDLNNEVWFFLNPEGAVGGIGAQIIDATQLTNFVSPKYSVPALANANAEDATPGYGAKVFVSSNSTSPSSGDQISVNNYTFDYKTGVIQFTTSGVAPTAGQYVYISVNQYVGRLLSNNISGVSSSIAAISASIGGGGGGTLSDRLVSLEATSASLLLSASNHEGRIDNIEAYTSSLKTALTASGVDLTANGNLSILGNLTVAGTTTTINSTTIQLGDNILELNGTGAANGGLLIKDPTAPNTVSGSLLWDSTLDYWKGGALGNESKLLRANGDSVVTSSVQIDITGTTGYSTFSGSISSSFSASADTLRIISASVDNRLNQLSADSGSQNARISFLETFSGSTNIKLSNLETYTASLNAYTQSYSASVSTSFSASNASITALSASVANVTGDFSASVSTSFSASRASVEYLSSSVATSFSASGASVLSLSASVSTSLSASTSDTSASQYLQNVRINQLASFTGSYATTGSNVFVSGQTISGSLIVTDVIQGTGSIFLQPNVTDARKIEIYNTAASDVHIKATSGLTYLGDDTNYVLVDSSTQIISITGSNGVYIGGISGTIGIFSQSVDMRLTASVASVTALSSSISASQFTLSSSVSTSFSASAASLTNLSSSVATSISASNANVLSISTSVDSRLDTLEGTGGIQGLGITNDVTFNKVTTASDVIVGGDLVVRGNTVSLNVSTLQIEDKLITLASGSINNATADGAGFEIAGTSAKLTYNGTTNEFSSSVPIAANVSGSFNLPTGGASKRLTFRNAVGNIDLITAPTTVGDIAQWNGTDFVMSNVIDGGTY
jgi:hypothetical protein